LMQNLKVITEATNAETRVLSPSVGFCSLTIKPGKYLSAGAFIGKLKIMNTNINLYLPADAFGKVIIAEKRDKMFQVEYKQELFRLSSDSIPSNKETKKVQTKIIDQNEPDDGYLIRASSTGIFYRRSSPDAPAYVKEGQKIEKGKIVGLIEVMKTFNHIVFQGTDNSDSGVIKKILCKDAQEVKLGEGLFLVE
jgi:biotin carboxyl carrier protein